MFAAHRTDDLDVFGGITLSSMKHVLEIHKFRKDWFKLVTGKPIVFIVPASFASGDRQALYPFSTSVIKAWSLLFPDFSVFLVSWSSFN